MNRLEAVAGISVLALVAAGLGQKYFELERLARTPDPEKPDFAALAAEIRPVSTLDAAANAFLANAQAAGDADKLVHLGEFLAALDGPEMMTDDLDPETSETVAKTVVETLAKDPDVSKDDMDLRRQAVSLLAGRLNTPTSKEFVLKVLDEGPQELREAAAARVGSPRGVRGPTVYAKIRELGDKGLIPDELLPQALRRTGGLKARPVLVALMESTDSVKLISQCAIALQDYREPVLMGPVLERLERVGRLESGAKMPWMSASLLDAYMQTADRPGFRRGLMAMAARPGLVEAEHVRKGLESPEAETRRIAAVAVKKGVVAKVIDAREGEDMLAGTLKTETEPVLKAELTGGLERVRGLLPATKSGQQ